MNPEIMGSHGVPYFGQKAMSWTGHDRSWVNEDGRLQIWSSSFGTKPNTCIIPSYRYLWIPSPQHDDARAQALVMECANVSTLLPPGPNPSADDVPPTRFSWVSSLGRIWIFKKKQNWNMIGVLIFYLLQDEYVCICVFCFVVWSDLLELSIVSRGAVFMFCFFVKKNSHFVSKCFHDQLLIIMSSAAHFPFWHQL